MSSGGICSFRCCSMPTFFNPGGRTFAGGDMMPLVIPWPSAEDDRVSIPSRIAAILSGCEFVLLLTALLPFLFYSAWLTNVRMSGGLSRCIHWRGWNRSGLRPSWQSALRQQLHGTVDRNARDSRLLIYPVIAVQLFLFLEPEVIDLQALVGFQTWLGESRNICIGNFAGVRFSLTDQGIQRRLMLFLVRVEVGIHPLHNEIDEHQNQAQAAEESKNPTRTQVLAFVGYFLVFLAQVQFVTHVPVPILLRQKRHRLARAASHSSCGRNKPATSRRWPRGQSRLPTSGEMFSKSSVR